MLVRQILIGIVAMALFLSLFRISVWIAHPSAGPLASQLRTADDVVISADTTAIELDNSSPDRKLELAIGTRCIVVKDPTGDEDDCYSNYDRLITVRVAEGGQQGLIVAIPRRNLRVKLRWYDLRTGR
jgi:hypothetical protein